MSTATQQPPTTEATRHTINMTISGGPESGKSTAAQEIANALTRIGFDVTVEDEAVKYVRLRSGQPAAGPPGHTYDVAIVTTDLSALPSASPPGPTCRSVHQQRVDDFMERAGQDLPDRPTLPAPEVAVLRAKLIFEEAFETIRGLGVVVRHINGFGAAAARDITIQNEHNCFEFIAAHEPNMVEIVDGCADLRVVTTGTLSAVGVSDMAVQQEVDEANLRKFGPGSYKRDDGKHMKPADFVPPDIAGVIDQQQRAGSK